MQDGVSNPTVKAEHGDTPGHAPEYDDAAIRFLEALWGEGFLSPGGPDEVRRIVADVDFAGKRVLDVGCGSGGITLFLAREYKPRSIVGFDVEQPVVDLASRRAAEQGLADTASFVRGAPGRLPFEDQSFDVVFSKDALIHVADKEALFADIFRVLKPGGKFAASDWLSSHDGAPSAA
ncbi:MAG: class I SAM-dependent methyltransferase, partial [Hoeflea sp.]|nr:class I SAM-dependent methyltransferase [Hoeflea sp.]